jgi:hypothetical protein
MLISLRNSWPPLSAAVAGQSPLRNREANDRRLEPVQAPFDAKQPLRNDAFSAPQPPTASSLSPDHTLGNFQQQSNLRKVFGLGMGAVHFFGGSAFPCGLRLAFPGLPFLVVLAFFPLPRAFFALFGFFAFFSTFGPFGLLV